MEITIENVRSFKGKHTIPIRPLTFIVGENSTGKTTFLSMIAAVCNDKFPSHSLFNRPPYDLGTFDTIASHSGGRWRSNYFSIGFKNKQKTGEHIAEAIFSDIYGQPYLKSFFVTNPSGELNIHFKDKLISGELTIKKPNKAIRKLSFEDSGLFLTEEGLSINSILPAIFNGIHNKLTNDNSPASMGLIYETLTSLLVKPHLNAVSIAPVRTKPHRTYDDLLDDFDPEGNHIPLILSRVWNSENNEKREKLKATLNKFGKESGLFSDIEVKKLGSRPGDPFQIKVKNNGPSRNLTDVGYGVSQSLPVIVESVLCSPYSMMLLQQPEVHLHPKAQAALGTFLSQLTEDHKKNFVVETHSDYLLDRVRQEVANKKISPDKVLILFFDRSNSDTSISILGIDDDGNIKNAPPAYRSFFLQEEMNLILRGKNGGNNS